MAANIIPSNNKCSICGKNAVARNLCPAHYSKLQKQGRFKGEKSRYTGHMTLPERLEYLSERVTESGCQIWTAHVSKKGYGRIGVNNKVMMAHRVAYEVANGAIPKGMAVCHRCDVPSCINPNHLFLGTFYENSMDMVKKGRHKHGESHFAAKLTDEDILKIRSDNRSGSQIAKDYGISKNYISNIKLKKNWSHV
jgi:hypothetical protein